MLIQNSYGKWYFFFYGGTVILKEISDEDMKDMESLNRFARENGINETNVDYDLSVI